MTYLAAVTEWLRPWGPVGWGVIGLLTFLLVAIVLVAGRAIAAWAASRRALARYTEAAVSTVKINPLDNEFVRQRINLSDFYHPHFRLNASKHFRECELFGPALIVFQGNGSLSSPTMVDCDIVIVAQGSMVHGAIGFLDTEFHRCAFYNVTLLCDAVMAKKMKAAMSGGFMNIISDGSCGPI